MVCDSLFDNRIADHTVRMGPGNKMASLEKFKTWLSKRGVVILDPTNEWEVVRFKTENGVSVVYTNKHGSLTFTGESEAAHNAWKSGRSWKPVDRKRKALRAKKAKLAARDGKRCFVHDAKMTFDELTIEHLLSFSHGGTDNINNLALVCGPCNDELGNMPLTKKIELIIAKRGENV
jgi:hypothetical protein